MNIDKRIEKSQLQINKDKEKIENKDENLPFLFVVLLIIYFGTLIGIGIDIVTRPSDKSSDIKLSLNDLKLQKKIEYLEHERKVQDTIDFFKEVNRIKDIAANVTTEQLTRYIDGKVDEVEFDRLLLLHGRMQFLRQDDGENLAEKINLHDEIKHLHGQGKFQILFNLEADGILQDNKR